MNREPVSPSFHLSDESLLEQVRKDDYHAYAQLYHRYQKRLLQFATAYTEDVFHSEEIVQEFFVQLWLKRKDIGIRRSLSGYFFRSVRNRVLNYFRDRSQRRNYFPLTDAQDFLSDDDIHQWMDRQDREQKINRVVGRMPVKYREVYDLRIDRQYSNKMTAHLLDRSVHTVDKQVRKIAREISHYCSRMPA